MIPPVARMTSGACPASSAAILPMTIGVARAPAAVDAHVATDRQSEFLKPLQERRVAGLRFRIIRRKGIEHTDAPHTLALLRTRAERPRCRRAAEKRDELAPPCMSGKQHIEE